MKKLIIFVNTLNNQPPPPRLFKILYSTLAFFYSTEGSKRPEYVFKVSGTFNVMGILLGQFVKDKRQYLARDKFICGGRKNDFRFRPPCFLFRFTFLFDNKKKPQIKFAQLSFNAFLFLGVSFFFTTYFFLKFASKNFLLNFLNNKSNYVSGT